MQPDKGPCGPELPQPQRGLLQSISLGPARGADTQRNGSWYLRDLPSLDFCSQLLQSSHILSAHLQYAGCLCSGSHLRLSKKVEGCGWRKSSQWRVGSGCPFLRESTRAGHKTQTKSAAAWRQHVHPPVPAGCRSWPRRHSSEGKYRGQSSFLGAIKQ